MIQDQKNIVGRTSLQIMILTPLMASNRVKPELRSTVWCPILMSISCNVRDELLRVDKIAKQNHVSQYWI